MYGPGRMVYAGRRRGSASPMLVVALVAGGILLFSAAGTFHFFPFFLLFWMVPFLLAPMLRSSVRGVAGGVGDRARGPVDEGLKEKEILKVLARHGEVTPARAALETSLGVSEADRVLSKLAKDGHVEVRAHEGSLGYALWEHDRRELTDGS
ncbi:MAG TPA: hypothetical protein VFJ72_05245 [Rubrobacteraceae bacterium]|nr:hypothetical protein [Rubrobacteraceae bacterium]